MKVVRSNHRLRCPTEGKTPTTHEGQKIVSGSDVG